MNVLKEGPTCQICADEHRCLLSCVTGESLAILRGARTSRHYRRGQIIFYQGDDPPFVFTVHSGLIKLVRTNQYNQELVIRLVRSGEIAGWRPILADEPAAVTAVVVEPCTVCMFSKAAFLNAVENSPALGATLLKELARELRVAEDRWFRSVNDTVEERVIAVLSELSQQRQHPLSADGPVRITVPRTEIAAAVGITPSTLSRTLRGLAARGMVRLQARTIDFGNISRN